MKKILQLSKALSDAGRLRALAALAGGELCLCQVIELLELAPSTVSRHMGLLLQAGLVETRKDGRWIYYRLPDRPDPAAGQALELARSSLEADPTIQADARRLKRIRKTPLSDLCAHYH